MTRAKQILQMLQDGEAMEFQQIAEKLEIPELKVRQAIVYLRNRGFIESAPVVYTITPKGKTHAKASPTSEQRKLRNAQAARRSREKRKEFADRLRSHGIITSVFQLGAQA